MPAYAIGRLETSDWSWLPEYRSITAALVEKHGGRYLASGGAIEQLEGNLAPPDALVVLEFPSLERARAWYEDPEYGPMIELRQRHCELDFLLVEGVSAR